MRFLHVQVHLQPQLVSCACQTQGLTAVEENVFENRFNYVGELKKFGAKIGVYDRLVLVERSFLHGASVVAGDLRGGAGLVLAGIVAKGETIVENIKYIDRGYARLEDNLLRLGADISRKIKSKY